MRLQSYIIFRRCASPDAIFFKIYAIHTLNLLLFSEINLCKLTLIYVYIILRTMLYSRISRHYRTSLPKKRGLLPKKISFCQLIPIYNIRFKRFKSHIRHPFPGSKVILTVHQELYESNAGHSHCIIRRHRTNTAEVPFEIIQRHLREFLQPTLQY